MKVAIGMIMHETNSWIPIRTEMKHFKERSLYRGKDIIEEFSGTKTELNGFLEASKRKQFTVIPTLAASAMPSGKVTKSTYLQLLNELLRSLRSSGRVDGVLLALQGCLVVSDVSDPEGKILKKVKETVGQETPVVCTLDIHANVTNGMIDNCDGIFGYDTYPEVDHFERGLEAGEKIVPIILGKTHPTLAMKKLPLLSPTQNIWTKAGPMSSLFKLARIYEKHRDVINVSIFNGFPQSDTPETGFSIVAVTNGNKNLAERIVQRIGLRAWSLRRQFFKKIPAAKEAIARAKRAKRKPVLLADMGDNPTGGSPGDGTVILEELLKAHVRDAVIATIWDPAVVLQASRVGVGRSFLTMLGAKTKASQGKPLKVKAKVRTLFDGKFVYKGPTKTGLQADMGRTAVLQIDGIDVIVTEIKIGPNDPELLRSVGIEPTSKEIIVLKSKGMYRDAFEPLIAEIIEVNTPGLSSVNLHEMPFRNIQRPIYPLDNM